MSPALGRANRSLYHASVLLAAWRRELERAQLPASVVGGAYGEAVQLHLQRAYGWFLLSLVGVTTLPEQPPASVNELLANTDNTHAGRGELMEFAQLETQGWLQALLRVATTPASAPAPGNLAQEVSDGGYSPANCADWQRQLESVMERMLDSMEES